MGAILRLVMTLATTLLAGVGVGEIMDKVAADKVPQYENPYKDPATGSINFKRILTVLALSAVGVFVVSKIFKKKIL